MLRAEGLQFNRGADVIFRDLAFVVHPGQRVAVAGRNGVGKSTLFGLIQNQLHADAGELLLPGTWRIASMAQEVQVTDRPALQYVIDGHHELRRVERDLQAKPDDANLHALYADLGGYEAESVAAEILDGLGFSGAEFDKPYAAFSGGWRIRLNLAQTLMQPCDLLLLDEPTNHLDLETIVWLERWLQRFPGTVMIIAHDRSFLDNATDHTLYLSQQTGELYTGNYSTCERIRAERAEFQAAQAARQTAQAAHMQQFIDRFRAKASKAKQVQSRVKALERMQQTMVIQADSPYHVTFKDPQKASNPLFSLREVSLGYGAHTVLSGVSETILPGDRIGVLGANGAGKSTLLKSLVGDLDPSSGELVRGTHSDVGYFAQHQLESVQGENTALATLLDAQPAWRAQQARDFLGSWGFSNDMTTRPIHTLSGGEKARLVLALIALEKPAVLVLDEPTNHLDLDMRDALALALQDYEGAVVIVSHDRSLLEKTVDQLWLVADGGVTRFAGDLADYVASEPRSNLAKNASSPNSRKELRKERALQRESERSLRKELKALERDMDKHSERLKEVESRLADSETYDALEPEALDDLLRRAARDRDRLAEIEDKWLKLSAELEASP